MPRYNSLIEMLDKGQVPIEPRQFLLTCSQYQNQAVMPKLDSLYMLRCTQYFDTYLHKSYNTLTRHNWRFRRYVDSGESVRFQIPIQLCGRFSSSQSRGTRGGSYSSDLP